MSEQEQVIKIDLSDLTKLIEQQTSMITEAFKKKETETKGKVYTDNGQTPKILESLRKIKDSNWKLTEQWNVVIPNYTAYEVAAHLRDYVYVSDVLKNEEGDVLNIPYVKDFDFEALSSVGAAITTQTTGLVSSLTTTLYEGAAWSDIDYYLIERIDQNLLEELNSNFAKAAIRWEDAKIMALVVAGTSTNFAGNVTRLTASAYFYASNIPAALQLLLNTGKEVKPNECVLYLTSYAYGALLAELAASQIIAYATPSIINTGIIEKYLGVNIVVGGYRPSQQRTNAATGTVDLCFLMRGKRAVAIAPKREILIETDKQISTRKLRITGSHTAGIKILDFKEIVRIWTSRVA